MKSFFRLKTALYASLLFPVVAAAAVDPVAVLPADTLLCVSVIRPEKLAALADHPVSKAVKLGGLKEIFGKAVLGLIDEKQRKIWEEECGMPPEKILTKFSGSLAAGAFGADLKKRTPKDQIPVEIGGAIAFDGDEALAAGIFKTLVRLDAPAEPSKKKDADEDEEEEDEESGKLSQMLAEKEQVEEHNGVKLHIHAPKSLKDEDIEALAWCFHDKTLFLATGAEPLREMLDRAAGKGGGSFLDSKVWRTARDETGDPDALVALDLGGFMEVFLATNKEAAALKAFRALGVDKMQVVAVGMSSDPKAVEIKVSVTYSSMPPVLALFKRGGGEEAPPPFLPGNLRGITWSPVDLKEAVTAMMKFLPQMTPLNPDQFETAFAHFKKTTGVDIEKELIGRLGTGYFQADHGFGEITVDDLTDDTEVGKQINIVAPKKEGSVIGCKVTDGREVESAVRALIPKFGKIKVRFDDREYMGFKIHRVENDPAPKPPGDDKDEDSEPPPAPLNISFVFADDWLLIGFGRQDLLERILSLMKTPSPDHLWKRPDVQRSLDSIPAGSIYTRYEDMNDSGRMLMLAAHSMLEFLPGMEALGNVDSEELLKGVEFPLHHVEKMYIEPRAFRTHGRYMVRPDAE